MFTGLIEQIGTLAARTPLGEGAAASHSLRIEAPQVLTSPFTIGESIAVNGTCLTISEFNQNGFTCFVSPETLDRTTLALLKVGASVNLERALQVNARMGGHWVQGHIDAIGRVHAITPRGTATELEIIYPSSLDRYFIEKGSVCVDGVSLTINRVLPGYRLSLMIVPHTLQQTIISTYQALTSVNLEVDLVAKYLEKLLQVDPRKQNPREAESYR